MNFGEIVREVTTIIRDASPEIISSIPDYVNEALAKIGAEKDLPLLRTVFMVTTDPSLPYVALSNQFDGRLLYVGTANGPIEIVRRGIEDLLELSPDLTIVGDLMEVAVEPGNLWYRKIPTVPTVLTCIGYYNPPVLAKSLDIPTCIPIYLHREILVNRAAAIAYSIIEDGLETPKMNTAFYEGEFEKGITSLDIWIAKRKSNVGTSVYEAL